MFTNVPTFEGGLYKQVQWYFSIYKNNSTVISILRSNQMIQISCFWHHYCNSYRICLLCIFQLEYTAIWGTVLTIKQLNLSIKPCLKCRKRRSYRQVLSQYRQALTQVSLDSQTCVISQLHQVAAYCYSPFFILITVVVLDRFDGNLNNNGSSESDCFSFDIEQEYEHTGVIIYS